MHARAFFSAEETNEATSYQVLSFVSDFASSLPCLWSFCFSYLPYGCFHSLDFPLHFEFLFLVTALQNLWGICLDDWTTPDCSSHGFHVSLGFGFSRFRAHLISLYVWWSLTKSELIASSFIILFSLVLVQLRFSKQNGVFCTMYSSTVKEVIHLTQHISEKEHKCC